MGRARRRTFAPADVYDLRAVMDRLRDGPRQVELRTGGERAVGALRENREDQPAAKRRDPFHGPLMAAKNHAGHMSAVPRGRPRERRRRTCDQRIEPADLRSGEARMRQIRRAIQHRDAHPRIAERFSPKLVNPGNLHDVDLPPTVSPPFKRLQGALLLLHGHVSGPEKNERPSDEHLIKRIMDLAPQYGLHMLGPSPL
jgi:hypothetical protein